MDRPELTHTAADSFVSERSRDVPLHNAGQGSVSVYITQFLLKNCTLTTRLFYRWRFVMSPRKVKLLSGLDQVARSQLHQLLTSSFSGATNANLSR